MIQPCRDCGAPFDGERWQRLCWSCWRNRRDGQGRDDAYHRGFTAGLAAARGRPAPALDDSLLRDVIALCHPDRHPRERYELANATTARLLALRRELAA